MTNYKLVSWNMEWMNDLFDGDGNLKPPDAIAYHSNTTVGNRTNHLSKIINEIKPDMMVITEGPNRTKELQTFFDDFVDGEWKTHIQSTPGSSQCIGIALRTDTHKFSNNTPLSITNTADLAVFQPFTSDTELDGIDELYHFERFPIYAKVTTADNKSISILGLHLKSKGIFTALEWSKWWTLADANRKKILAQCSQIRLKFLDQYLISNETKDIPLILCGDINDGPGMDASERRLFGSGIERLMGIVWHPELCLKNALFEHILDEDDKRQLKFEKISTTSFKDPIFNNTYIKSWIDHILYSNPLSAAITEARIYDELAEGKIWEAPYQHSSDHYPIAISFDV